MLPTLSPARKLLPPNSTAQAALDKVTKGDPIDSADSALIEAIVVPHMRPAVPLVGGSSGDFPSSWQRPERAAHANKTAVCL